MTNNGFLHIYLLVFFLNVSYMSLCCVQLKGPILALTTDMVQVYYRKYGKINKPQIKNAKSVKSYKNIFT